MVTCKYCGGNVVLNPDGEYVCTVCGTIQGPLYVPAASRAKSMKQLLLKTLMAGA
jgi:transcription initiation factor TFIIIB Brf1 subunit/transcription initiation factor TFIIB